MSEVAEAHEATKAELAAAKAEVQKLQAAAAQMDAARAELDKVKHEAEEKSSKMRALAEKLENERRAAEEAGESIHARIVPEIAAAMERPSTLLFHPYLFGSPHGGGASADFLGLRGWHDRGDMLRAVIEGIAFNHRVHVDTLREGFAPKRALLTGGISRNPLFAQIFADVLGMPVTVTETEEAAAWGAALCAGAGVGLFSSPTDDPRDLDALALNYSPDPARSAEMDRRYRLHVEIAAALAPFWPRIEALAETVS